MSLSENDQRLEKTPEPCIFVIFGATGDLTSRKLLPALYNLARENLLPSNFACVGFARREKSDESFRKEMKDAINQFSRNKPVDEEIWKDFEKKIYYHRSEFDNEEGYESLKNSLNELDEKWGTKGNRVFYLSTPPSYFPDIVQKLKNHHLIYDINETRDRWSRIIIEKPFGFDLKSAISLQKDLTTHLNESQIYRIDHYLGKETVQNLLVFRFANPVFEFQWNNRNIDNIQVTVSEEIGIGTRGKFFEEAGMLRDIVQNHMMQLLSLLAMEPPTNLSAEAIHDEKVKVLQSIRKFSNKDFSKYAVRGQYGAGIIDGKEVKGYREENDVSPQSNVETYAAIQFFIDNWRWAGVPFYLRAGKRLPKRLTEIVVTFKKAPGFAFEQSGQETTPNLVVIRIQPDEGISLNINCKVPGQNTLLQPVKMDFRYGSYFGATPPEAYERLIWDCLAGDRTLFARDDEVLESWKILNPILEFWQSTPPAGFPNYPAGSWGPIEAERMLQETGRNWRVL
ncbi:Glucose-6-phosphate 1-dehydrogenase [Chlamydiales bacterium STE3]|nr:Glucose-6-phosphate 1-dehydrogenase [Chlamydiales bacterium STE3]